MSRHLYLYKASYHLCRFRKIVYSTSSHMAANCSIRFSSREVVPVLRPAWKPWRTLWKTMEDVKRQLVITKTTLHTTFSIPMPIYSHPPLGSESLPVMWHPLPAAPPGRPLAPVPPPSANATALLLPSLSYPKTPYLNTTPMPLYFSLSMLFSLYPYMPSFLPLSLPPSPSPLLLSPPPSGPP